MKDLSTTLLIICLLVFSLGISAEEIPSSNFFPQSALNGAISVYYDLNGIPYIYIDDYTKKDGSFVKGYYRSLPDKNKFNNWSTKGNINPFSGKKGYEKP